MPSLRKRETTLRAQLDALEAELIPACVQHSVLDPAENRKLAQLLPGGV
jgi:hypothetical protein